MPVIPFDAHYDESEIEYIKHERVVVENNEERDKFIERVPRLSEEAEPFAILRFLAAFARACKDLAWTTGPKLYQKFRMHLTGYPLELWDTTIFGNNRTVPTFNVALNKFKNELLQGYHYEGEEARKDDPHQVFAQTKNAQQNGGPIAWSPSNQRRIL